MKQLRMASSCSTRRMVDWAITWLLFRASVTWGARSSSTFGTLPFLSTQQNQQQQTWQALHGELLRASVPKAAFDASQQGTEGREVERRLNDNNKNNNNNNGQDNDDYYMSEDSMYSLSGYSLKYVKCQPVQQFSDSAANAGEYSPMVVEDVVILRLCPSKMCSSSREYGCHYNFAEYVIGLKDYVRIMLRYTVDRRTRLCNYCDECGYVSNGNNNNNNNNDDGQRRRRRQQQQQQKLQQNRFLNEEGENDQDKGENNKENEQEHDNKDGEEKNDNKDNNEKQDNNNNNEDNQEAQGDDGANAQGDDGNEADSSQSSNYVYDPCDEVDTYCSNYDKDCAGEEGDTDDKYIDYLDYMDYLNCAKVDDKNNNRYYVRPRCDGYESTIKMAIYRDPYCSMYAGNDVSLNNLGLGFRESIFEDFYAEPRCISCAETTDPPDFGADATLCNRMHQDSAKCTANLVYDAFDGYVDDSTECSFIESVRFGTYDELGQYSMDSMSKVKQTVTKGQLIALGISAVLCVLLALYACYLHHSITNLLIYSLSHSHLLPPSRHRSRSRQGRGRSRQSRRYDEEDEDWDRSAAAQALPPIA